MQTVFCLEKEILLVKHTHGLMKSGKTTEEETTIQYILQAHKILMTSHGKVDGRT